ncbi:nuclear transport factor 2 family protein [Pseudomonas putida]|uniref:Nuclear transport factor 2 family protein n=1 Tax=Pseudomonas putida TaxID=303 RepID=A0A8I1EGV1_PSEPU|nr:nuclear transport factor 2 family protein [Pseudomonas putida]MBI6884989.1 nuclear transport factor 2 family protein [Pseudomonas putida]
MLGVGLLLGGNAIAESAKSSKPSTYVEEYTAIAEVLSKYNEGGRQAKSSIMKPAFNEKATIFGLEEGRLVGGPIQNLYDVIDGGEFKASPQAHAAIVSVDIVGDAASARVDTDNISGYRFTDFFQLLKVGGKWTIMSKIYYSHPTPDK